MGLKTFLSAAVLAAALPFSVSAATLDFFGYAATAGPPSPDQGAVANGSVINFDGVNVTFNAFKNGVAASSYFDLGAGLGVCGYAPASAYQCIPSNDDNVTATEIVTISWTPAQTLSNIIFRAEGHGVRTDSKTLLFAVNGGALARYTFGQLSLASFLGVKSVSFAYDDGTFTVGDARNLAANADQFYISSAVLPNFQIPLVPLPATGLLLLGALGGLGIARRRRKAA